MDIVSAVEAAVSEGKCIATETFPDFKIRPTNDKGNCIVMRSDGSEPSRYEWQPTANDLMRKDWKVVD